MSKIITWITSYPRSGNTYTRILLYNYFYNLERNFELDPIEAANHCIPDLYADSPDQQQKQIRLTEPNLVKAHDVYSGDLPLEDRTKAFIYLIRNPRDVLLSVGRYLELPDNDYKPTDFFNFSKNFILNKGSIALKLKGFGSWPLHVATWLIASEMYPSLYVKYEELIDRPEEILTKIINFLGYEVDRDQLEFAVEASKLSHLKDLTERGVIRKFTSRGGKSNQDLSCVSDEIEDLYQQSFLANIASIFGYN